jgi:hypothetical protein
MLKKNKNIEWTSPSPNKKIRFNEQFENTSTPSFKGFKLWLDAAQLVGKDGKQIQVWSSVQNVISGGGSGIADLKSTDNQANWPIVKENIKNKLQISFSFSFYILTLIFIHSPHFYIKASRRNQTVTLEIFSIEV